MYCVNCEKPVLLLALIQLRVDDLNFAYNVILEKIHKRSFLQNKNILTSNEIIEEKPLPSSCLILRSILMLSITQGIN